MTKIDLITGILGSGKTTFIIKYAKYLMSCGMKIAILENDFGAVNVDMMMLQDLKGDSCRLEMISGGCDADCHRRRFKTQLIALGMQHFDRVIIEPSGIFDMDEFFDTLYESPLDRWFEIGSIFSIVDAELNDDLSDQMEYLLGSEASCSGKLLISKLSAVSGSESPAETSERILSHINRSMEYIKCRRHFSSDDIICREWDTLTDDNFSSLMSAGYRNESYVKLFSNDNIRSMTHYFMHIRIKHDDLRNVIEGILSDEKCGKIYRIKGFTQDDDGSWLKLNAADGKIEIAPISDGQSVFIVIGDNVDKNAVDEHFKRVNSDPEYVSI